VLNILDEASQVRTANERLRELDRMKDDFISTVTHELRTPLTSIRAFSELLNDDPEMPLADRTRFLGIIVSEVERLSRLINQILDLARLEAGRSQCSFDEVDLSEMGRLSIDTMSQLARDKGTVIETRLPDVGPKVIADQDRLMQVMLNLLSNAVKFVAPGGGRILVTIEVIQGEARISVADNGPGIRMEDRERVFEKFRQGVGNEDMLTGKPQGTGLGLAISRQIIENFGGLMWVEGGADGGACFICTLPLSAMGQGGDSSGGKR